MVPSSRDILLFDLDGTLVDSAPDMADAVDAMLVQLGKQPVGEARVRDWVGNGARRLVMRALTGDMDGEVEAARADQALTLFLEAYRAALCVRSRLYPGVREGLDALRGAGFRLACVTNKPELLAVDLVNQLGLAAHLPVVVGGDTTAERKPSAQPLLHALRQLDGSPQRAIMVGDSVNDISAGRNAGMPVYCVPYGYNHGMNIRDAGADAVVDDIMALYRLLGSASERSPSQLHGTGGMG
ncbi:phosphoglycolate phosphatase [Natronocella acetinitrilica]|uniref:Phosphoglycolate phosphatase n=1 Tax=Natronocella acetinitrilica TaxID=414046 RepID=A0AAE3G142_9GAMM|nr:phosphoglycolate phosphatase [Natronocella acetinitrilica]MCP1673019.1 phosphoglycolate phosphatase [Natronocella acetinitrilica]